jgi:16S rRNA processing protein RimM
VFTLQVPSGHAWHGKTLELSELRYYNGHAVGFFKGVDDRTAAEGLAKAILWVSHDLAEPSNEEDAWYDHQLVGLAVIRDGVKIGTIRQVNHLPVQDLLVVATDSGDVLVPFVKAIVPSVDIKAGTLTVTPPHGLFEELPADEPEPAASPEDAADAEAEPEA